MPAFRDRPLGELSVDDIRGFVAGLAEEVEAGAMADARSIGYTVGGETFLSVVQSAVSCPGTYRLSISVLTNGAQHYPPFGSATFTAR